MQIGADTFMLTKQRKYMYYNEFPFILDQKRVNASYYRCLQKFALHCPARLIIKQANDPAPHISLMREHNHSKEIGKFKKIRYFHCKLFVLVFY